MVSVRGFVVMMLDASLSAYEENDYSNNCKGNNNSDDNVDQIIVASFPTISIGTSVIWLGLSVGWVSGIGWVSAISWGGSSSISGGSGISGGSSISGSSSIGGSSSISPDFCTIFILS